MVPTNAVKTPAGENSLDLLRLVAALMVLYSHQYAVLGLPEPVFIRWDTVGRAGVAIFFFLSGYLVWSSWDRDPHVGRFFGRRMLRIFPALWLVCLLSVFVLGPAVSVLMVGEYFASAQTWTYLLTGLLVPAQTLPGLFTSNHFPLVVNGSLWTLPVEFLCYCTVPIMGLALCKLKAIREWYMGLALVGVVAVATYGPQAIGVSLTPHLEMVAMFWWGAVYGYALKQSPDRRAVTAALAAVAFLSFALLGPRGGDRAAILVCAAVLVHLGRTIAAGERLTRPLGDLSYGVYIFAFPVQQAVAHYGQVLAWSFLTSLLTSAMVTLCLAYLSWHALEKRALRFKPAVREVA